MTDVMTTGVDELRASIRGGVIGRDDPGYDESRKLYNAMIDKRPALIARCADVADVIAAVNFGRENGLDTAIRGGGHNGGGLGSVDDGVVIDLSPMNNVRVDPQARSVTAGGGALLGGVDHATSVFGLALPTGIISTTGVGGLTLGGGTGHLTRGHGLTIDHLLSADVVLADGSLVKASEDENEDLRGVLPRTYNLLTNATLATLIRNVNAALGNIDGDVNADLAVANFGSNDVTVLLGRGNGTFSQPPSSPFAVGSGPRGLSLAIINHDAFSDLAVANFTSNNVSIPQ